MSKQSDWTLARPARREVIGWGVTGGLALSFISFPGLLAACSSSGTSSTNTPKSLVAGIDADPATLNPAIVTAPSALAVCGQMFNTLLRLDAHGQLHGELAESWKASSDGLTYTVQLRKGIKWHDGQPFTSADPAFSFLQVSMKYSGQGALSFGPIASIDTPNDYTMVIHLKTATPSFFPWALCDWTFAQVLPKHIYEGTDPRRNPANTKPVGTGAFKFVEWVAGDHVTVERNPNFWKSGEPSIDRLVFKIIPSTEARVAALEKGEVDYIPYFALPTSAYTEMSKVSSLKVDNSPRPPAGLIVLFYNVRHAPLNSVPVRQAIAYAIDRKALVAKAIDGLAKGATSLISSAQTGFHILPTTQYSYDVAKANSLLDQAGYPKKSDGTRLSLRFSYDRTGVGGSLDAAGQLIREQLKQVGIDIQLQPLDNATWSDAAMVKWDFDLTIGTFSTGPDPSIGLDRLFLTSEIKPVAAHNFTGYSNPQLDAVMRRGEVEVDHAKRKADYAEVQGTLARDVPALGLWENVYLSAFNKKLTNLPAGPYQFEPLDAVKWTS